jgi:hypothetical protein
MFSLIGSFKPDNPSGVYQALLKGNLEFLSRRQKDWFGNVLMGCKGEIIFVF